MPRSLALGLIALVVVVAAGGVSLVNVLRTAVSSDVSAAPPAESSRGTPPPAAPEPVPAPVAGPTAPVAPPAPAVNQQPRAGRVFKVEDAFKELDLIRPSRQKLAQDFTLKTPDGKSFKLSEHRGKLVFVNFWATWCPPCREEMPAMERLYQQHKDRGFMMVAVSLDADPAVVPPFLKENRFSFAIGLDPKMQAANAYGVRALPSSFIVDRQGQMAALALGPRKWDNDAAHSLIDGLAH